MSITVNCSEPVIQREVINLLGSNDWNLHIISLDRQLSPPVDFHKAIRILQAPNFNFFLSRFVLVRKDVQNEMPCSHCVIKNNGTKVASTDPSANLQQAIGTIVRDTIHNANLAMIYPASKEIRSSL